MPKYRVMARTILFKEVGVYEADSKEEALDMAIDDESVEVEYTPCYHCSKEVSGVELETLIAEEED